MQDKIDLISDLKSFIGGKVTNLLFDKSIVFEFSDKRIITILGEFKFSFKMNLHNELILNEISFEKDQLVLRFETGDIMVSLLGENLKYPDLLVVKLADRNFYDISPEFCVLNAGLNLKRL